MNVLMVLRGNFPPDARVRKQTKTLINAGHSIRILCEGKTSGDEMVNDAEVIRVSRPSLGINLGDLRRSFNILLRDIYPFWRKKIEKELERDIDIIHVHDLPLAKTVNQVSDVPVVLDLHENYREAIRYYRSVLSLQETLTDPKMLINRICKPAKRYHRIQQLAMEKADKVIAVVPEAKEEYVRSGINQETVAVISNTVDLEWFDEHIGSTTEVPEDNFNMTYVGSLSGPHRGIETIVKSLSIIEKRIPNIRLVIAGGGPQQKALESLANEVGVSELVQFTGWIDETEFPKYMNDADIGIVPHNSNPHTNTTIPHKLFQYMAASLPVIVTDTAAVGRVVRETKSGIVIPPKDKFALSNAVVEMAQSESYSKYSTNGRIAVEEKYNWTNDGNELKEVYSQLEG